MEFLNDNFNYLESDVKIKRCNRCGLEMCISLFYVDRSSKDGHRSRCKFCLKQYREDSKDLQKEYRQRTKNRRKILGIRYRKKNKEKLTYNKKLYYKLNRETILLKSRERYSKNKNDKLEYQKKYQRENKKSRNSYLNQRRKNDPLFNLITGVRNLIGNSFRENGFSKISKTQELLGCSFEELKLYLESKFEIWMNWNNKGLYNGEFNYGWDIDHIIPLSTAENTYDIIKLCHYTNLQPLCSKINREIKRNNMQYGVI